MEFDAAAVTLTDLLGLAHPPVALSFQDRPREDVAAPSGPSPSACAF